MYKNIISFSFLLLPEMYEIVKWKRESKMAEMYTQGEVRFSSEPLLLRSAVARVVQGHLKATNHLNLNKLLNFHEYRQFFVLSSSFLAQSLLCFILFPGYPHNLRGHTTRICVAHEHASSLACHPHNLRGTSDEEAAVLGFLYGAGQFSVMPRE